MTRCGTLELCTCGCTQQVHELTEGPCVNPECPIKCQVFQGTGKLHESAFCKQCTVSFDLNGDCLCTQNNQVEEAQTGMYD